MFVVTVVLLLFVSFSIAILPHHSCVLMFMCHTMGLGLRNNKVKSPFIRTLN